MTDNIVTKTQIIDYVADELEITKVAASRTLETIIDYIVHEVSSGSKVSINKFGVFETRHRSERKGRNPQTGEEITIKATTAPAFKAAKSFKEKVSELALEQLD